jgi:glycosyltransferase involved in cell wall biosynthesis
VKILVLTPSRYDSAPGMRFRMEQWARHLTGSEFGFRFEAFTDESLHRTLYQPGQIVRKSALTMTALLRRFRLLAQARDYDAVFLHREAALIGPAVIERLLGAHLLGARTVPLIYDFDDPIWLPYRSPRNPHCGALKFHGKTAGICRLARSVVVGNRLLAGYASRFSKNVHIVPSTVDLARYPKRQRRAENPVVTLGWTGSHSTLPFFEQALDILRILAARRRFRVIVISHTDSYRAPSLPVEVISRKWRPESEAADLQDIDVGLAPFPDSGWTPWRCHGKVLQYMAAGIPSVASNIGILPDYIEDGITGYLPNSPEEWVLRLERLIDNPGLREKLGAEARARLERRYSAEVWAPRVGEILRAAVAGAAKC